MNKFPKSNTAIGLQKSNFLLEAEIVDKGI